MFRRLTAIAALLIAGQTYAQSFIADTIPYAPEAKVADRIRQECTDLGTNLSRKIIEQAKAGGRYLFPEYVSLMIEDLSSQAARQAHQFFQNEHGGEKQPSPEHEHHGHEHGHNCGCNH